MYELRVQKAQTIADLVGPNPDFNYEALFSQAPARFFPKQRVISILKKYFDDFGPVQKLSKNFEDEELTGFYVEFSNGTMADLFIDIDDHGLINKFFFAGSLPGGELIKIEEKMVPMRDGSKLRALVLQKNDGIRKPVILERSPYLHFAYGHTPITLIYSNVAKQSVQNGYVFILQGVRGTGGSEGIFKFLSPQEAEDGFDAVMWSAKEKFSTGSVGATGGSYDGFTAIATATLNPEPLKIVVASSYFTNMKDFGGLRGPVELFHLRWFNRVTRGQGTPAHSASYSDEMLEKITSVADIRRYDQILYGATIPGWQELASAWPNPESLYWTERSIFEGLTNIRVPTSI